MQGVFPLWGKDTNELATEFIEQGFKAITCCIDNHSLGKKFVGRQMDTDFFNSLPEGTDPCGENGEFHSFVYDGPIFKMPINIKDW